MSRLVPAWCADHAGELDHLPDPLVDINHMVFITKASTGRLGKTDWAGDGCSR